MFKKKFSIFISILLSVMMLLCTAITVSAAEPRLSDTCSVSVHLVFDNTTAYCTANVQGAKGTTSITNGKLVLTDSNGNIAAEWSDLSSNGTTLYVSKTASGMTKGEEYTLTFTANVNRNGRSEAVSNYVTKTC